MATEVGGEGGQVKLLGATFSGYVLRVRLALALKGIAYDFIEESNMQNKSQLLLQSNPVYKKIPVLIHNGKSICESINILEYIDEAWNMKAPNLMPKDPYDRAIIRFWAAFLDSRLGPCIQGVFRGQGEQQMKAVEESEENFLLLEEALRTNSCFSGKVYFGGDKIGLMDIALGAMSIWIKTTEKVTDKVLIDPNKMPLLTAWMDRFCESSGVKEIMPDSAKLLEFVSGVRARITSAPIGN